MNKRSALLSLALGFFVMMTTACAVEPTRLNSAKAPLRGEVDYMDHCASCHGTDAKGNGPVAQFMTAPTPDLTILAQANGGDIPKDRLFGIIDGRIDVLVHGSRSMPVWGNAFRVLEGEDPTPVMQPQNSDVIRRIDDLIAYLGSIQE